METFSRPSRPRVILVSYASGKKFEDAQTQLDASLDRADIDAHWRWNASSFESGHHGAWYEGHRSVNFRRGGSWKPYIILQALLRVRPGDWVIYHDSSQYFPEGFSSSVRPLLAWLESQKPTNPCECLAAVRLRQAVQHEWEQRCAPPYGDPPGHSPPFDVLCGVLQRIGACPRGRPKECCQAVWLGPMMQHAWSVWRKGPASLAFVHEWVVHSMDPEVLPVLPFVDQSLNGLLLHKLHRQLGIRVLWVPALYEASWSMDHDLRNHGALAFGRNDGTAFKHLNHVLDMLYNEKITGKTHLWMLDLGSTLREAAAGSVARLSWDQKAVPARLWQRSLCVPIRDRPALAATVTDSQLFLSRTACFAHREPWGPGYRAPVAWRGAVHERVPRGGAPGAPTSLIRDDTDYVGEFHLYERGLSEALFLGAWHLDALPSWAVQVIVSVGLFNDGSATWPRDAGLCHVGGNFSFPGFGRLCIDGAGRRAIACGEVRSNQRAVLLLAVPLSAARARARPSWHEADWALCNPADGRPFGVLLRAMLLPGRPPLGHSNLAQGAFA